MFNFKRPAGEKPYYYATSIKDGEVISHDGEEEYAIYESEMDESTRRANLWHKWVEKNYPRAYNSMGAIDEDIFIQNAHINRQFMNGERES